MQHLGIQLFSPFCAILSHLAPLPPCSPPSLSPAPSLRAEMVLSQDGRVREDSSAQRDVSMGGLCEAARPLRVDLVFLIANIVG